MSEMNGNRERIDTLRGQIENVKAEQYPIRGHLLEQANDYTKNHYFKMLCLILQYAEGIAEAQTLLLRRLVKGCGAETSAQDYMRQALRIEDGDFAEFAERAVTGDLRFAFALDALILAHLAPCGEDFDRFLAEFFEGMGMKSAELAPLARLCRCILARDAALFAEAREAGLGAVPEEAYLPYLDFYAGLVSDANGRKYHRAPADGERRALTDFACDVGDRVVVYENLKIALREADLVFTGCEEVRFVNCELIGNEHNLVFKDVGSAVFERCAFSGFTDNAIVGSSLWNLSVADTAFTGCGCDDSNSGHRRYGVGLIWLSAADSVALEGCRFVNCYLKGNGLYLSAILGSWSNENLRCGQLILRNNEFAGCKVEGGNVGALIGGAFDRITAENNVRSGELTRLFMNDGYERDYGGK
jgi:hypothetical protein